MSDLPRSASKSRWQQAQQFEKEYAVREMSSGDDWNKWWKEMFLDYREIFGRDFSHVLEVGCGPHTNLKYILPVIHKPDHIYLEDPLIQYYLMHNAGYLIRRYNLVQQLACREDVKVDLSSCPLECLPYRDGLMDLVVCINVLDHVWDYDACMSEMCRVLRTGGTLILAQDLTNAEDFELCPETITDIGHPIKMDLAMIRESLEGDYHSLWEEVAPRSAGRNPKCHYATYLGILEKDGV